eukprot:5825468-Prymnesium_polylepis.3
MHAPAVWLQHVGAIAMPLKDVAAGSVTQPSSPLPSPFTTHTPVLGKSTGTTGGRDGRGGRGGSGDGSAGGEGAAQQSSPGYPTPALKQLCWQVLSEVQPAARLQKFSSP